MDTLIQVFGYLFPTGIGTCLGWIFSRNVYQAKKKKQVHDIYQQMYDDVCATLEEQQNENKKLYKAVTRLEKAITKATACKHFADCPVRGELQEQQGTGLKQKRRKSEAKRKTGNDIRARPGEPGDAEIGEAGCQ